MTARAEARAIHLAACRYRAQGLICSLCRSVVERAERAAALAAQRLPAGPATVQQGSVR